MSARVAWEVWCSLPACRAKFCSLFRRKRERTFFSRFENFFGTLREKKLRLELITEKLRGSFPSTHFLFLFFFRATWLSGTDPKVLIRGPGTRTFWHGKGALTRVRIVNNLLCCSFFFVRITASFTFRSLTSSFFITLLVLISLTCIQRGHVRSVVRAAATGRVQVVEVGVKMGIRGFGWVLTLSGHFGAGDEEENAHSIEEAESQSEEGRERVGAIDDDEEALEEGRRREM